MVHLPMNTIFAGAAFRPEMQKSSLSTAGQGFAPNGMVSTLHRQPGFKTASTGVDRGSCPSSVSCPVFPAWQSDPEEDQTKHPSLSSPTSLSNLHESGSTSAPGGSTGSLKSSASCLTSRGLQGPTPNVQGSAASSRSSSPSIRSSSSSLQSGNSSENDSWSSGATCLLRSSIKQHSEEVFRDRAGPFCRTKPESDSEAGSQNLESSQASKRKAEAEKTVARVTMERKDSAQSQCSSRSSANPSRFERRIEAKLKFSNFLDEVSCRVLDPDSLQAFGVACQEEASPVNRPHFSPVSSQGSFRANAWSSLPTRRTNASTCENKWKTCAPSCKVLDNGVTIGDATEAKDLLKRPRRPYLETDRDGAQIELVDTRRDRDAKKEQREPGAFGVKPNPVQANSKDGFWGVPYFRTCLPRPGNRSLAADGAANATSTLQEEEQEDLRVQLFQTSSRLEMLEKEFESTRKYLEAELRRAQEELEKFTDKLRRIQSSYAALQRINQGLEDKVQQAAQHHEEEKVAMSREIILLKDHLMEAKTTIEKLRQDNELYRKDCKLAAQLLQCKKSHYRAHKLSELPVDPQDGGSPHSGNKKRDRRMDPDAGPGLVTEVLPKLEPGSSCPVTRSPSPQPPDSDHLVNKDTSGGDTLRRRAAYRSLDLYSSDTALYCPGEESRRDRWQERRQSADPQGKAPNLLQSQNSTDSNPEEDSFYPGFARDALLPGFAAGSTRASSTYSSFSAASDDKGRVPSSTLSSSHLALYMDWPEGDYEQKSLSSYGRESPRFPKSLSFQHMTSSPEKDLSPVYSRTASCYSEPYQMPRLSSSHGMGLSAAPRDVHFSEDELMRRWRRMSVEDVNAFSYRRPGLSSPYSFSEQHFATGPCKIRLGPLYSSFQEGDEVFQTHVLDARFPNSSSSSLAPSPNHGVALGTNRKGPMCPSKFNSQDSRSTFFRAGSSKDNGSTVGKVDKEYVDVSLISSAESLHQNPQHYLLHSPGPSRKASGRHRKFVSTGLSRKDSLTRAQLYGTLLN